MSIAQNHMQSTCIVICREAVAAIADRHMQYSYAKMLLSKSVELDSEEYTKYIVCIARILGV